MMPTLKTSLTLTLALGFAASATASPSANAERGRALLQESTELPLGREATTKARGALELLEPLAQADGATCEDVILAAEAALRADQPDRARPLIGQAHAAGCDRPVVQQLTAWTLEFNDEGARRGPGAPLAQAQAAYVDAAELFEKGEPPRPELARIAYGSAAEVAASRRAWHACTATVDRALKLGAQRPQVSALAVLWLQCRSPLVGEGAALSDLQERVPEDVWTEAAIFRQRMIQTDLLRERTDPIALAARASYALISGNPERHEQAHRDLLDATALEPNLPDAWFLLGRLHAERGRLREAADAYARQAAVAPSSPATPLAVNNRASALATLGAPKDELEGALTALEKALEGSPKEPAMHHTQFEVLKALGRTDEARAALRRAIALHPDPAWLQELDALE